jgi:hypothetical protein
LERAVKLMVKAGYRSYSVTIKVAGKEKRYGLMESRFYLAWSRNVETRRRRERCRLWHPWLHINRVQSVIHPTRVKPEAWA